MRRLIIEEPVSRAAIWSGRTAWFALAVTAVAVAFMRFQLVDILPGFVSLAAALGVAVAAVLLAFAAFVRIWMEGRRGVGEAVKGLVLALVILAYPGLYALRALTLPALNDISTDIDDPPAFSRSRASLEARNGRLPPDVAREKRIAQRDAYPQVAPLTLDLAPEETFDLVRKAAANRGWQVIETVRPGGRVGLGRIEAVDRSFLLRLPDDITVRIRPRADGSRIDVRSASRIGTPRPRPERPPHPRLSRRDLESGAGAEVTPAPLPRLPGEERYARRYSPLRRRRALGRNDAAGDEVLEMGEDREPGGAGERRLQALVDRRHHLGDGAVAGGEAVEDRGLALAAVMGERAHHPLRLGHRPAVPRPVQRLVAPAELVERGHEVAHRAVGRADERGRPGHDVVGREQRALLRQREAEVVRHVPRRLDRLEAPARPLDRVALGELEVGRVGEVGARLERRCSRPGSARGRCDGRCSRRSAPRSRPSGRGRPASGRGGCARRGCA